MSDEMKYTERDMVLAKRAGFAAACAHLGRYAHAEDAMIHYPLPKITRMREVADPLAEVIQWRVDDGSLMWSTGSGKVWNRYPERSDTVAIYPTPERVALWADLLANPTEGVEAGS